MSKAKGKLAYSKSNDLVQLRGTVVRRDPLTETKRKIIALEASKVKDNDTHETIFTITPREFVDLCGLGKGGKTYEHIFSEIHDLKAKVIAFVNERGNISIESYMDNIEVDRESGEVRYTIPKALIPHFQRYAQFTRLDLIEYMPMRGQYALLLYELLMSWREKGEVYYSLEDLRKLLEVPEGTYPNTGDFLKRAIYSPVDQINKRLRKGKIKYVVKWGQRRRVDGVTFYIPKPSEAKELPEKTNEECTAEELEEMGQINMFTNQNPQVAPQPSKTFLLMMSIMDSEPEARAAYEKYGEDHCAANLNYLLERQAEGKVNSPKAYFRSALANDYAGTSSSKRTYDKNCPKCHGQGKYTVFADLKEILLTCDCDKKYR